MNKKSVFWSVRSVSAVLLVIGALTSFSASANLLTAGDFESVATLDGFWASSTDVWGAENGQVTGAVGSVSPTGSQMLRMNHAGGGSVSQAHQMVAGPFTAGSTVTFEMDVNTSGAGVGAQLYIEGRDTISSGIVGLFLTSPTFLLDADASTWQTITLTGVLAANYNILAAEIRFVHNSALSTFSGFADNAVLTVEGIAVPAPAVMWLFGVGLIGLGIFRRKLG